MSKKSDPSDNSRRNSSENDPQWPSQQRRQAVLYRDRERCGNCLRRVAQAENGLQQVEKMDIDHNIPRGNGGSHLLTNLSAVCRKCHDAKDNDELASTIEFSSSKQMDEYEFRWFQHLWNEILPALTHLVGPETLTIEPMFNLDDREVYHIPTGEVVKLAQSDEIRDVSSYNSMMAADYW